MKCKTLSARVLASSLVVAIYAITAVAADADVGVTVNGSAVDISPAPIVQAGRVFVPLRGVFEQLGASVVYSDGAINATGNGRDISLRIGSTQATVNGQSQIIDVAPFIVGASTYVPLRFISEALGDSVSWDNANSIAAIDTSGGAADYYSPGTASYVDTAPPPMPSYEQPYVPQPNYIWQPGYWAWGSNGYYWVPGTWVAAPQPDYLWTPGYWQGSSSGFHFNPGYWARAVGFYGGVNYGGGYNGSGYDGGQWSNNDFRYNTYVTRVNTTIIKNVYVDRNVYVNTSSERVSYNGGKYGLRARPSAQQVAVDKQHHVGMTPVQQQHVKIAEQDRRLLATVNHDKPPVLTVARPLSQTNRPAALVPVKAADRVNPLAHVAPVRVPAPPAAATVKKAPVARIVRPANPAPIVHEAVTARAPIVPKTPAPTPLVNVAPANRPPANRAPAVSKGSVSTAPVVVHEAAPANRAPAVPAAVPAPVHAPAVYAAPIRHAPVVRAAPTVNVAPAVKPVPAVQAAPAVRAAPVVHAAPAVRAAPAVQAAPAVRPAPVVRPAPAVHAAPPAPATPAVRAAPPAHAVPPPQSTP